MQYLYGASVQGIQGFIFETNELREIIGASEIVEDISSRLFHELVGVKDFKEEDLILGAAGGIRYLFSDKNLCEQIVYQFPSKVQQMATGITVSQAVVRIEGNLEADHINELERRLIIQRNKKHALMVPGLMVSERSRKTGNAGTVWQKPQKNSNAEVRDLAQYQKGKMAENARTALLDKMIPGKTIKAKEFSFEMDELAGKEGGWVAVVHADGNDLGRRIMEIKDEIERKSADSKKVYRLLSNTLADVTNAAAQDAFNTVVLSNWDREKTKLPVRPVVLGGDDITVMIRGDLALDFTHTFLKSFQRHSLEQFAAFERETGIEAFSNGLSACAGISYVKPKYPFHYAVRLAESLCKHAKKVAKDLPAKNATTPACLVYHKVHSSFVEKYSTIIKKELSGNGGVRYDHGPYFLEPQANYATIQDLKFWLSIAKHPTIPKTAIKGWLEDLHHSSSEAEQTRSRILTLSSEKPWIKEKLTRIAFDRPFSSRVDNNGKAYRTTHLFDVFNLLDLQNS
jgi:hypothetical protein